MSTYQKYDRKQHCSPPIIKYSGNRRRTDNTMTKRKRTKVQAMIYKTLHIKLKIEQR